MPILPRVQREVLLALEEEGRLHAYAIKRRLRGRVGHSSVYAALSAAQAKGFLRSEWELPDQTGGAGPPRKYFRLTPLGRAALAAREATASAHQALAAEGAT